MPANTTDDTSTTALLRRLYELLGSRAYVGEVHRKRTALDQVLGSAARSGTVPDPEAIDHADALVTSLREAVEKAEQIAANLRAEDTAAGHPREQDDDGHSPAVPGQVWP